MEVAQLEVPEVEHRILEQVEFDCIFDDLVSMDEPQGIKLVVPRHQSGRFARYLPPRQ
ncbi:hypothetical protein BCO71033_06609 [Burkholderia contaminans]|uniref:Uncharacterized protein n=2 Tax=Burkholderia contaminans TaxID=488447 RepID=A0A6P3BMG3_9BURK|nr:hypothetical protein BCO71033_06609 [Burkholderia contaminans]